MQPEQSWWTPPTPAPPTAPPTAPITGPPTAPPTAPVTAPPAGPPAARPRPGRSHRSHQARAFVAGAVAAATLIGGGVAAGRLTADSTAEPVATVAPLSTASTTGSSTDSATAVIGAKGDVTALVAASTPGVVTIRTQVAQRTPWGRTVTGQGTGTGIIISDDGVIVTNAHVVADAAQVSVTLDGGTTKAATVVGADTQHDIAVIKIGASGLHPLQLGDSSSLRVGTPVVAIGNALALPGGPTATEGIVSALGRDIDTSDGEHLSGLIQTDAAINPGNSGGPLLTLNGEVAGINSAGATDAQNIGFAIPVDDVRAIVDKLIGSSTS